MTYPKNRKLPPEVPRFWSKVWRALRHLDADMSNYLSLVCLLGFQPLTLLKLYDWHIQPRWPGSPDITYLAALLAIFVLQVCLAPATIKREPHDNTFDSLVNMGTCSAVLLIGWLFS